MKNKNYIIGDKFRITMITERLIRLEYNESNIFEDRKTQAIINRDLGETNFSYKYINDELIVETPYLKLTYNQQRFSKNGLSIKLLGNFSNYRSTWFYGEDYIDLGGTARTLDKANGSVELSKGLMSKNGYSVYDDSNSLIMIDDETIIPRENKGIDIYFFGYGHDYKGCLEDFYKISGNQPLLPRYALGNWWSRYYKYTEQTYKELLNKFDEKQIPFSVVVFDMDWHLVNIDKKYGSGWTGYTWNKEFFPNPERFLQWINEKGMKVTLNVHPADGIRAFEENYLEMAKELGIDYKNEEAIEFDITNKKFRDAYFKYIHHPNEDMGVSFWWIDWQQQSHSKVDGLDPLWLLNHFHFLDNKRKNVKPLTFSRYAGIGSHRYPIGFSGDTYITWESLDFQPYFTATASNVGYGWWSHDIGGHMRGYKDDELQVRWLQYGVFSPINRLHCSDNIFCGKEPWNYNIYIEQIMTKFLRLRHMLIPYLYTMNVKSSEQFTPLILPLYYEYPENKEAYEYKNQYFFGENMLVCPITTKSSEKSKLGKVEAWLPDGLWYDFFTDIKYKGNCKLNLFRDFESIPVLVKAGSIIPLNLSIKNEATLPEDILLKVYAGDNGYFELIEDDEVKEGSRAKTQYIFKWEENSSLTIKSVEGNSLIISNNRKYQIQLIGMDYSNIEVNQNGNSVDFDLDRENNIINLKEYNFENDIEIKIYNSKLSENNILDKIYQIILNSNIEYDKKFEIYKYVEQNINNENICVGLLSFDNVDNYIINAIIELLYAYKN